MTGRLEATMPNPTIFDLWTVYVVLAALPLLALGLAVCGLVRLWEAP